MIYFLLSAVLILNVTFSEVALAGGLYFIQPDKSSMGTTDLDIGYSEQKVACEDLQGVIDQLRTQINTEDHPVGDISYQARVRGFGSDTFSQESDIVVGVKNTTQDYTFTFSPAIDTTSENELCDEENVFLLGFRKQSGGYLAGKLYGSTSHTAYRDSIYTSYNTGLLLDIYFEVNPENYVPLVSLAQTDKSKKGTKDLSQGVYNWSDQRISCEDASGIIEQTAVHITTENHSVGDIGYIMRIKGVGSDSFYQESNVVAGVKNTTQDYTFTFSPPVDTTNGDELCDVESVFILGVQKNYGSYLAGKLWGSLSETAYRNSYFPCYQCGLLRDMYFVMNP